MQSNRCNQMERRIVLSCPGPSLLPPPSAQSLAPLLSFLPAPPFLPLPSWPGTTLLYLVSRSSSRRLARLGPPAAFSYFFFFARARSSRLDFCSDSSRFRTLALNSVTPQKEPST